MKKLRFFTLVYTLGIFSLLKGYASPSKEKQFLIISNSPINDVKILSQESLSHIVALDGAANYLKEIGLTPHTILGDFDSLTPEAETFFRNQGVTFIHTPDQNKTDLEKGIEFCDKQHATKITIINAFGGRMDHSFGNLSFLKKYNNPNRVLKIISENQCIEILNDCSTTITGRLGDYCGILGFPTCTITSKGLKYDMDNYALTFGQTESICNQLAKETALIEIQGDALVISPCIP